MSVALAFTACGCAAAQQPPKVPPSADASQSETKTDKEKIMPESYPSDLQQLAQIKIDLDILAKYFHPELPGRKPLRLLKNTVVSDDLALTKFGEPVRWVSADEAEKRRRRLRDLQDRYPRCHSHRVIQLRHRRSARHSYFS